MKNYINKQLKITLGILPLVLVGLVLAGALVLSDKPAQSSALSGSDFQAGRIIDDAVFYNDSAMTVSQIQQFLNARVPNCDTNGDRLHSSGMTRRDWAAQSSSRDNPPYTCLKEYTEQIPSVSNSGSDLCTGNISGGNRTAARIIHDVGKACGINPQVLIVMLQKEQSLITDDWPWEIQYNRAMGYACPDSGPNNSANCNSAFYGFFNQVYNAAQAFRRYEANPTWYNYRAGRNNSILYHPNTSCGSSNVFIENQATASLYIYTPYQPNQAALNNLYGTGNSCSSYGNRNFWRMFNDWFGSTTGPSNMVLIRCDGENYLVERGIRRKRHVPNHTLNDWNFSSSMFRQGSSTRCGYSTFDLSLDTVIRSRNTGHAYLIQDGEAIRITDSNVAESWGIERYESSTYPQFNGSNIHWLNVRSALGENSIHIGDGDLVLFRCDEEKYIVERHIRRKRLVAQPGLDSWGLQNAYFGPGSSQRCGYNTFALPLEDIARARSTGHLHIIREDSIGKITDLSISQSWNVPNFNNISAYPQFNDAALVMFGEADELKKLDPAIQDANFVLFECDGSKYLVERNIRRKRSLTNESVDAWGIKYAQYEQGSSRRCGYDTFNLPLERLIRSRNTGRVYYVEDGVAWRIHTQSRANQFNLGNLSDVLDATYPQFEPESIHFLDIER